ncbi:MAG: BACON domain-containing protein [Prevotella sp.]|nr:BACON domain-containing protein [Prevotella sp.]
MKKILLFAVAALIAGSASAQTISAKKKAKTNTSALLSSANQMKMVDNGMPAFNKSLAKARPEVSKIRPLDIKDLKSLTPIKGASVAAPRKAGALQPAYTGSATNYRTQASATWTLSTGTLSDEASTPCLVNVIPSPFTNYAEIPVTYTVDGSTIKIPAQEVATASTNDGTPLYVYLCNIGSSVVDGSHTLTLGDDNSLTSETYYSSYCFFTEEFSEEAMAAGETDWSKLYTYYAYTNVKYVEEGKIVAPVVMYEPDGLYLHAFMSPSRYWYGTNNYAIVPAYAPVALKNFTTDLADEWSWTVATKDDEPETVSATTRDFSFNTVGGEAYEPATLIGSNQGVASDPYQWGLVNSCTTGYLFAGETASDFEMSDGTVAMITKANPDNSFAYYGFLGTPDVNSQNYSIENLILYQGKPSAPFYFTGINFYVKDFEAKEGFNLKCKIVKATRSATGYLTLGDVIAEADVDAEATYTNDASGTTLYWNEFYVEDELGMSQTLDYLFVEDEFAIVFEGWDNGTFSAIPYGEYYGNDNTLVSTFAKETGDETIYRYTDGHMMVGFTDATYGYLYTEDATELTIPAEGGEVSIHVEPMFSNTDGTTRLFLDDNSEEIPDWLHPGFANENYSDTESSFDLVFQADALPAGEDSRSVELTFFQEGAKLTVTVTQETTDGINTVTTVKANADGKAYNLSGQRINGNFKGVVIKEGKKFIQK